MISHDSYHHQGRRVSDRPVVFWLKFWIRRASDERRRALTSTAFVSEEKETSARGRLVGIARAVHRRSRLRVSFSCLVCFPLVVVLWCVGNPDLWDRGLVCFGEPFFCGLFTPTNPLPGHRLVPESHLVSDELCWEDIAGQEEPDSGHMFKQGLIWHCCERASQQHKQIFSCNKNVTRTSAPEGNISSFEHN